MDGAHVLFAHYLLCAAVCYISWNVWLHSQAGSQFLAWLCCHPGSCRPSGGSAQLLPAKGKLSQERLFQTGSWSRRERSTSATNAKVWKLWRTGSRNITAGFRANGRKSFSLHRAGRHPFLYKKFCFSCRFLQNWVAAWATGSFQRQDTA